jgi:hypothetical protein
MSRILLDECIPRPLARHLPGYYVRTAPQTGWAGILNGELIKLAETDFDVFVTMDKGILLSAKSAFDGTWLYLAARAKQSPGGSAAARA